MTTPADIDAIRERADEYAKAKERLHNSNSGSVAERAARITIVEAEYEFPRDIAALLAHVDAQAERVRTLEAALRPFAALRADYLKYAEEQKVAGIPRWQMSDFTAWIDHFGADPDMLMQSCKQAADALAANADAGNGGA